MHHKVDLRSPLPRRFLGAVGEKGSLVALPWLPSLASLRSSTTSCSLVASIGRTPPTAATARTCWSRTTRSTWSSTPRPLTSFGMSSAGRTGSATTPPRGASKHSIGARRSGGPSPRNRCSACSKPRATHRRCYSQAYPSPNSSARGRSGGSGAKRALHRTSAVSTRSPPSCFLFPIATSRSHGSGHPHLTDGGAATRPLIPGTTATTHPWSLPMERRDP